ncbi:SxtJ family membrane protein [Longitalea luteola]|uniref:SxtJ family membrane protein n=1 Tax=Longitalea luteola TaxID=2812563 RepID=UPI0034E2C65C
MLFPALTNQIHWLWMKLGEAMGFVTSKIVLTIIFYIFLVPLSFLAKLRKRQPVKLKPDNNSLYTERNFEYTRESMEHLW